MSDGYSKGGHIPGPGVKVPLHPAECVYNRHMECVRSDHTHDPAEARRLRDAVEARIEEMRRPTEAGESTP